MMINVGIARTRFDIFMIRLMWLDFWIGFRKHEGSSYLNVDWLLIPQYITGLSNKSYYFVRIE